MTYIILVTYPHTTFRFYLINFQLNAESPSKFCIFTIKKSQKKNKQTNKQKQNPFFAKL